MVDQNFCDIFGNQAEYGLVPPRVTWRCPRCGGFSYDSSEGPPAIRSPDEMVRLSGWVREQNAAGVVPVHITPEISRRVAQMPVPGLRERASRVLVKLARDKSDALFSRAAIAPAQRNGVYFEAGFAIGLGLTAFPTCRADEVPKLHFDIKHLNTLLWNTPAELAEGLNKPHKGCHRRWSRSTRSPVKSYPARQ